MPVGRSILGVNARKIGHGDWAGPRPEHHTKHQRPYAWRISYGIVLSGEIDLELDSGEVHLTPGDIAVQRGTRHAWRNRSQSPCSIAFVLISSPNYS